jgi:hypothetical protein
MGTTRVASIVAFLLSSALGHAQPAIQEATGKVVMLRVHEPGTGYGAPSDYLDADVIVKLDTDPGKAFGFALRDDGRLGARREMLTTLRGAFKIGRDVTLNYSILPGRNTGMLLRVWPSPPPEFTGREEHPGQDVSADPAVREGWLEPSNLKSTPENRTKGGPAVLKSIQRLPPGTFELEPGERHSIAVEVTERLLLMAVVSWQGSEIPVTVAVVRGQGTLLTGDARPFSSESGRVRVNGELSPSRGTAILVTNQSKVRVKVQFSGGVLPLASTP